MTPRPVLVARCDNYNETSVPYAAPCPGEMRFTWGAQQAKCTHCNAWCGIAVANWVRVEPPAPPTQAAT